MKKILFLAVVIMMSFIAQAQSSTLINAGTFSTTSSLDTVTANISATAGYSAMGIQVVATKVSGTVAGKAYLMSSLDGTNFTVTDSSAAFSDATTNSAFFTKTTTPYTHYRVQVRSATGAATTQNFTVKVYYVLRRHN